MHPAAQRFKRSQYIADQAPDSGLAPAAGTLARYRLIEWLNFVTTELHKKHMWMVFGSKSTPELKAWSRANAPATLAYVERYLADREYLVGDRFTVADIYLFWTLLVAPHGGIALYTRANPAAPKADAPRP